MAAVNYRPTEKLNLTLSGTYTDSDSGMDSLADYTELCAQMAGMSSYHYDLHLVDSYSELDIAQTDISLNAVYALDEDFSIGCGLSYLDYEDDKPYLYDGSGDAYFVTLSLTYYP